MRAETERAAAGSVPVRVAGATAGLLGVTWFAPIAARSTSHPVVTTLITAALAAAGSILCLLGRWWEWACALAAAGCMTSVAAASVRDPSAMRLALGHAAIGVTPPVLGAMVLGRRRLTGFVLLAGVLAGPVHELVHDPFLDQRCTARCVHSPLVLVHLQGTAIWLQLAGGVCAALVLSVASCSRSSARWALVLVALDAWMVVLHPESGSWTWSSAAALGALVAVSAERARDLLDELRLTRLIAALSGSDDVEATLRHEVGDDRILVSYAVAGDELPPADPGSVVGDPGVSFVDGAGAIRDAAEAGLVATDVVAAGRLVARIHHGEQRHEVRTIVAALNGPSLLAFGLCRLRALTALQSERVRSARLRIVVRSDEERRSLERDVHDGAQQQVLALGMEIELAMLDLGADSPDREALLACSALVRSVLGQLRDVAHGLRPGGVDGAGLDAALHALCSRARVPVSVHGLPTRSDVETDAVVVALLRSAIAVATAPLAVRFSEELHRQTVSLEGVAAEHLDQVVEDRIAAIGGRLRRRPDGVLVELPCVP